MGLLGCRSELSSVSAPVSVKVAVISRLSKTRGLRFSAQVEPAKHVDLAFRVGGYIDAITSVKGVDGKPRPLQGGDRVRVGQELARLRTTEYEQKVAEAKATLAQARAVADQSKIDFERSTKLASSGAVSPAEVDAVRAKLHSTQAAVDVNLAMLSEVQTALGDTSLRSPLDGVVIKRRAEVGSLATPGTIAFSVADTDSVKVVFGVPDTELVRMRLGSVQEVTNEAYKDEVFAGKITRIAPIADPLSRSFEIEVTIANADQRLKAGMIVALKLKDLPAIAAEAPLAPIAAIVRSNVNREQFAVFVVVNENGRSIAHLREVELGDFAGNSVPIAKGLNEGERVVIMGAGLLSDGDTVAVID
jgi:multidrug efflux system membrane fusion protein